MDDLGKYKPVNLTLIQCKIMERLIQDSINQELKVGYIILTNQCEFTENSSCQTN